MVIVVEENHSFGNIIGNASAPYFNSLATQGALFTDSAGIAHPSEPNYLALFSGSTQGVSDDSCPHTFSGDNLGAQVAAAGETFAGYSEGLPQAGYSGCTSGDYARRHAPWTDFPSVPASASLPFSEFPQDYKNLPTVSFVIPNVADDMHDGSISAADSWMRDNLDGYAQWAKTHNSLLVVTWDEDEDTASNHVATIFEGAQVNPGQYSESINHYKVLRTIEAAYGLPALGQAADMQPITDIWK
ncbi:alkaline phosphatase family protein [Sinomonas terrae]|uniref:Alkaline phosphatase family protein n=1 Tax=Sinomonas terrae TaxID=2908838 RepID=A0ABS9U0Y8_9MICC|nr:alkaline phosphatase family protein [Sinomonas terrae]MCH6470353.1 alkaline phosphatase family protein [Sinomonas terrae]